MQGGYIQDSHNEYYFWVVKVLNHIFIYENDELQDSLILCFQLYSIRTGENTYQ